MLIKRIVLFAITSGLAAKGFNYLLERAHQRRARERRGTQQAAVQRWEDEGGSLKPQG